jgi:hypothetical protein
MTDIKVDSLFKKLEKYSDRISKSEQLLRGFLIKAAIVTPKGNLKRTLNIYAYLQNGLNSWFHGTEESLVNNFLKPNDYS